MATQKHSGKGGFSADAFLHCGVPEDLAPCLAEDGNFALTASSWKTYETVDRHLEACEADIGRMLIFPLSLGDVLTWVAWLIKCRGIRAKTIQVYLSGLRIAHLKRGYFNVNILGDIVRHVLTGLKQRDLLHDKKRGKKERQAVTLEVLRVLRSQVRKVGWAMAKKRMVWAVIVLGFSGSLRVHEILAHKQAEFDPTSTLLAGDLGLETLSLEQGGQQVLKVRLKAPKEARLRHGVLLDLFPTGNYLCPMLAIRKYVQAMPFFLEDTKPLFRRCDGFAYTGAAFNRDLKELLQGTGHEGAITSHSLRAGLASEMGTLGYSEAEIMEIGRWHSAAYLRYVKNGRLQRMKVARQVAQSILK